MKLWGRIKKDNDYKAGVTVAVNAKSAYEVADWSEPFAKLCHDLDIARPVILKKHVNDLERFSHTAFLPADFMEAVDFDKLEIEVF